MLSAPPPSTGYGLSAASTQGGPVMPGGKKPAKGGLSLGAPGLSASPLSPQVMQQNKLAMMVKALSGMTQ